MSTITSVTNKVYSVLLKIRIWLARKLLGKYFVEAIPDDYRAVIAPEGNDWTVVWNSKHIKGVHIRNGGPCLHYDKSGHTKSHFT